MTDKELIEVAKILTVIAVGMVPPRIFLFGGAIMEVPNNVKLIFAVESYDQSDRDHVRVVDCCKDLSDYLECMDWRHVSYMLRNQNDFFRNSIKKHRKYYVYTLTRDNHFIKYCGKTNRIGKPPKVIFDITFPHQTKYFYMCRANGKDYLDVDEKRLFERVKNLGLEKYEFQKVFLNYMHGPSYNITVDPDSRKEVDEFVPNGPMNLYLEFGKHLGLEQYDVSPSGHRMNAGMGVYEVRCVGMQDFFTLPFYNRMINAKKNRIYWQHFIPGSGPWDPDENGTYDLSYDDYGYITPKKYDSVKLKLSFKVDGLNYAVDENKRFLCYSDDPLEPIYERELEANCEYMYFTRIEGFDYLECAEITIAEIVKNLHGAKSMDIYCIHASYDSDASCPDINMEQLRSMGLDGVRKMYHELLRTIPYEVRAIDTEKTISKWLDIIDEDCIYGERELMRQEYIERIGQMLSNQ